MFAGGQDGNGALANVDIYDAFSNTWSSGLLSATRHSLCAAGAGNKIVFAGGIHNNGSYSNIVDIYDTTSGTWSTATLSQGRGQLTAAAYGNKIYIAGGITTGNIASKVIDIYDVVNNTWSVDSLSQPRANCAKPPPPSHVRMK